MDQAESPRGSGRESERSRSEKFTRQREGRAIAAVTEMFSLRAVLLPRRMEVENPSTHQDLVWS